VTKTRRSTCASDKVTKTRRSTCASDKDEKVYLCK
jgi:hypothetical protein